MLRAVQGAEGLVWAKPFQGKPMHGSRGRGLPRLCERHPLWGLCQAAGFTRLRMRSCCSALIRPIAIRRRAMVGAWGGANRTLIHYFS